jgi:hypothetical protein
MPQLIARQNCHKKEFSREKRRSITDSASDYWKFLSKPSTDFRYCKLEDVIL